MRNYPSSYKKVWTIEEIKHLLKTNAEMVWRSVLYIHYGSLTANTSLTDTGSGFAGDWWSDNDYQFGRACAEQLKKDGWLDTVYTARMAKILSLGYVDTICVGTNCHPRFNRVKFFKELTDHYSINFDYNGIETVSASLTETMKHFDD